VHRGSASPWLQYAREWDHIGLLRRGERAARGEVSSAEEAIETGPGHEQRRAGRGRCEQR
jgi:hypothetical protein